MSLAAFKTIKSNRTLSRVSFAWLILFCITFGSLPVFGKGEKQLSDLVFCPLQKRWVKPDSTVWPAPNEAEKPLDNVCTSSRNKIHFIAALSKTPHFGRILPGQKNEVNLFFKYLDEGKQAFAEIAQPYNSPDHGLTISSRSECGGFGNYQKDFNKTTAELFLTGQFPRPPTIPENTIFSFQIARRLKSISRNINPRSPPRG